MSDLLTLAHVADHTALVPKGAWSFRDRVHPYAYWFSPTDVEHDVPGLGSHLFIRLVQPARVSGVRIQRTAEQFGTRPQRVTVYVYPDREAKGQVVFDGVVTWDGDIGDIKFDAAEGIAVSIRCDRKEPVRTNFYELHPSTWTVPFDGCLPLTVYGRWTGGDLPEPDAPPLLQQEDIAPADTRGLRAAADDMFVRFESKWLRIAFSLKRPRIAELCWDGLGTRRLADNLLVERPYHMASGPWARDAAVFVPAMHWGGRVEVCDQRVVYRDLESSAGFRLDAEFEVEPRGFRMRLRQHNPERRTLLEAESWRFAWSGETTCSLNTLARPVRGDHRNGRVEPRGAWHASGRGSLAFEPIANADAVTMQADCTGFRGRHLFGGFQLGVQPEPYGFVSLSPGRHEATLQFKVVNVEPALKKGVRQADVHRGLRRAWGSVFTFRPELSGFSNNSFSINCQNGLYVVADMLTFTRHATMPDLLDYSLWLATRGGMGYGSQIEQANDAAPSMLITAARLHQVCRSVKSLKRHWPHLRRHLKHILDHIDDDGMYVNRFYSGNSGLYARSANVWDTMSFGHHDGYSAALAFRALHGAHAMASDLGDMELAETCRAAAERLPGAFERSLFNPETGWFAAWRSADGKLHDHASTFVNGMAISFGMIDAARGRDILERLEHRRRELHGDDFRYGIPPVLKPVPLVDYYLPNAWQRRDGADGHGVFLNGGLTPVLAGYYFDALSLCGFDRTLDAATEQLLDSYDARRFDGSYTGVECFTFDGIPSGYEGTLFFGFQPLMVLGWHRGWIEPTTPRWWPAPMG